MGNELQVAAIDKLYSLYDRVKECDDESIKKNWDYLQTSDHFYYMATKFFPMGLSINISILMRVPMTHF